MLRRVRSTCIEENHAKQISYFWDKGKVNLKLERELIRIFKRLYGFCNLKNPPVENILYVVIRSAGFLAPIPLMSKILNLQIVFYLQRCHF